MMTRSFRVQKLQNWIYAFVFLFLAFGVKNVHAQADGAKLYKQNCAVCHKLDDKKLTGPGLKGVFQRVPSEKWFIDWVLNNDKLTKSGDAYAVKISQFDASQMTIFEGQLSEDDVKAIAAYVKNPPVEVAATVTNNAANGEQAAKTEEGIDPFKILIGVVAFLVILISILRSVKHSLKNVVNEKEGKSSVPEMGMWEETKDWLGSHKRFVALAILFLVGWGLKTSWYTLKDIGVYEGYKPEQPIKFSHKIHAGDNAINCVYCHNTVEKSRHASIPSVNVCMNCHKGIDKGPTTGTTEIAKIYEAAGFNPETQAYDKPQKPLKWVKVHNLQDFVYFNHSQHVVVGKQDCANCHGDVKEMTVAQQVQPLTMGWCIDCHKKTEVAMDNNPYYEELHKKLAEKYKGQKITVDKIGGIECVKCHY